MTSVEAITARREAAARALLDLREAKIREGFNFQWWIDLGEHVTPILDAVLAAPQPGDA